MPDRPNILFLLSDEHSYRFLSARSSEDGGEPCHTPTLDGLIRQGVHLHTAYCQMPLCVPSRVSLLSGRHSHRCPVLWPDIPTVASHLSAHGYATAAVGKMHLVGSRQHVGFQSRPYGDFGGFPPGHQKDPLSLEGDRDNCFMPSIMRDPGVSDIPESMLQEYMVVREAVSWLREHRHAHGDQPWLMYASFCRPHFPLRVPRRFFERYYPDGVTPPRIARTGDDQRHPLTVGAMTAKANELQGYRADEISEEQTMRARAAYLGSVDQVDEILGDLLAVLARDGLLDNTVIVYTSDHGELAGEHGLWFKNTWHEASVRVPLIVSMPQHRSGELAPCEIAHPASLGDLFPTLCGLTGIPAPADLDGIDLSPAIRGEACQALVERPGVIVEHLTSAFGEGTEYRMIRTDRFKYIAFRDCDDLAYDLLEDPDEQHNLVGQARRDVAAELASLRASLFDGFDFAKAIWSMERQNALYRERYPIRIAPRTSNQILRGDGLLVEADQPLNYPDVVSRDLSQDLDDCPD